MMRRLVTIKYVTAFIIETVENAGIEKCPLGQIG